MTKIESVVEITDKKIIEEIKESLPKTSQESIERNKRCIELLMRARRG